ncbi:hypothetical protein TrST_g2508 [Triparma strigata]|uniref:Uncharacterized protein n=1 Tax=Triparma strigata TaxID=1606541 RepID=A0A9W7AIJ4_9STRA|nr:hypothetical protein TrST_g2508 [Triparma strigata]
MADPNFGLPPEEVPHDWEFKEGADTFARVTKIGRSNQEFLQKLEGETVDGTGSDQSWKVVKEMGKESLELRSGTEVDDEIARQEKLKRMRAAGILTTDPDEDKEEGDSDEASDDSSDSDSDEEPAAETPQKNAKDEAEEDENSMLDNDWDTSEWSMQEIESACSTLITECESPSSEKRQQLSIRMLLRLLDRHQEAVAYVEKVSESLLNKAFPAILVDGISEEALNLSHLLAAIAPRFADGFSMLGPIGNICKILTQELDLAAHILQWRYALRKKKRQLELAKDSIPQERYIRKKMGFNMKSDELNQKWRKMHASDTCGLSPKVRLSHLKILSSLCDPNITQYATANRLELVKKKGLIPVVLALQEVGPEWEKDSLVDDGTVKTTSSSVTAVSLGALQIDDGGITKPHQVACLLSLQLAQERSLLLPLVRSLIHEGLQKILDNASILPSEDVCMCLEVLDVLGAMSCKSCDISMSHEDYVQYEQMKRSRLYHDENYVDPEASDCPNDIEDEGEKAFYRKATREAVTEVFVQPHLITSLVNLLEKPDASTFLGTVLVLHKFGSTWSFRHVLTILCSYSGRGLEYVVSQLQSDNVAIQLACLSLLRQLCTSQDGRDCLITSKICDMLMPLISGKTALNSSSYQLALTVFIALAQFGSQPTVGFNLENFNITSNCYANLMNLMTSNTPGPVFSVDKLISMRVLKYLVRYVVGYDDGASFFAIGQLQKEQGVIALHRIFMYKQSVKNIGGVVNDEAETGLGSGSGREVSLMDSVLSYFAYALQTFFTHHFEHRYTPQTLILFYASLQSSLRGLGCIASFSSKYTNKVLNVVRDKNVYKEIEELLRYPNVKYDESYNHKIDTAEAAAFLVTEICLRPEFEHHDVAEKESTLEERDDVNEVEASLKRISEQMSKPLMDIVHGCPNPDAVSNACLGLARLGGTNVCCNILIKNGITRCVGGLFPEKPSLMEGPTSENIQNEIFDVHAKRRRDEDVDILMGLDASAFTLVAAICRIPKGCHEVQSSGLLRRCMERFHLTSGKKGVDLVVRGEIAKVFSRCSNGHTVESGSAGSANDYILNPNYNSICLLVEMIREGGKFYRKSRFWATSAIAELCRDTVRVVPLVIKWGAVDALAQIIKDYTRGGGDERGGTPQPLLRPCLVALNRICKFPLGAYTTHLVDAGLKQPLVAIASNVQLQIEYAEVKSREGLGGYARDILYSMTEAEGRRSAGIGPTGGSIGSYSELSEKKAKKEEKQVLEEEEEEEEEDYVEGDYEDDSIGEEEKKNMGEPGDAGMNLATFDGTYSGMGVTSIGSLADNVGDEDETMKMRISQMDAEDPAFRNELKRRKEHYEMGATYRLGRGGRRKSVTEKDTKSSGRKRRGSAGKGSRVVEKIEAVKTLRDGGEEEKEAYKSSSLGSSLKGAEGEVEGVATTKVVKTPASAKSGVSFSGLDGGSPGATTPGMGMGMGDVTFGGGGGGGSFGGASVLDVKTVPILNSTRPTMPSPKNKDGGGVGGVGGGGMKTSKSLPSPLLTPSSVTTPKGKNLVTFTRPKKSNGLFIDPTFIEVAPVSGLSKLGNHLGAPSMLSSASLITDLPSEKIETYTHTANILGSTVKISGQRVAGPGAVLDDEGRPMSAVTFENVHEATVRRELEKLRSSVK